MNFKRGITYIILGLAVIGLSFQLFKNPLGIVKSLFFLLITAVIIFAIVKLFIRKTNPNQSNEMKKYKQAVKQSKQRYQQHQRSCKQRPQNSKNRLRRKNRPTHLRVIDGQKSKNKDRATF